MKQKENLLKDEMWYFLRQDSQKTNIPALKEAVSKLIQTTTQKDAGQRDKMNHIDWDELWMIQWQIIIEATCLVLSGELDKLEERGRET